MTPIKICDLLGVQAGTGDTYADTTAAAPASQFTQAPLLSTTPLFIFGGALGPSQN